MVSAQNVSRTPTSNWISVLDNIWALLISPKLGLSSSEQLDNQANVRAVNFGVVRSNIDSFFLCVNRISKTPNM